jgi:uncharacterized membrane protein (UPF0127 family)
MRHRLLKCDEELLVPTVLVAETTAERMRGLLAHSGLPAGQAMFLCPCTSIHTFFMRFSIDIIFVSTDLRVTRIVTDVTPFRVVFGGAGASGVLEFATGCLPSRGLEIGDQLTLLDP